MTDKPKLHDDFDSFNVDDDDIRSNQKVEDDFDSFNIDDEPDTGSNLTILGNNQATESNLTSANDNASPGVRISEARKRKKMSVLQVSEDLNLDVNVIERIEADDYAKLPQSLFVRGYLRSLSKLLNIDEKSILASFEQFSQGETQTNTHPLAYPKQKKQVSSRDLWPTVATIGIIVTLIALVALWQFYPQTTTEDSQPFTNVPTENHDSSWESSTEHQPITQTSLAPEQAEDPIVETTPEPIVETTPEPIVETTPEPLVQSKTIRVLLKKNVWMRISDKTGTKLYGGTAKAGEILELEGLPPYKVVVGNFHLDIEYQGVVRNVQSYPKSPNSNRSFIIGGEEE